MKKISDKQEICISEENLIKQMKEGKL